MKPEEELAELKIRIAHIQSIRQHLLETLQKELSLIQFEAVSHEALSSRAYLAALNRALRILFDPLTIVEVGEKEETVK